MTRDETLTAEEVEGKDRLKKEAEDYVMGTKAKDAIQKQIPYFNFAQMMYLAGAEPREKQIQIDAEQIRALQRDKGNLTDKVRELEQQNERLKGDLELWESGACRATNLDKCSVVKELKAQIEKMKCCSMCKYYSMSFLPYCCTKNNTAPHCTSKCDKWEIKEK